MKKLMFTLLFMAVTFAGTITGFAQRGRADTAEVRERQRQAQQSVEDPANNPFKIEPYEPLKPPKPPESSPIRATVELEVVGAVDGDTLIISNTAGQHVSIRIQGIDAPESGQAFYNEATKHLASISTGKVVSVEFNPHGKPDADGRIIAKVYLDGDDMGLFQVKAGFAWYCKEYMKMLSESDRYTYAEAEKEARGAGRGLWHEHSPQAPWLFRKQ
jgi:endonuclease YncB( thermonuclease family)